MARGKAKVNYLNREGLVAAQESPDWSFIYEKSIVKHPHYNIGDRVVLPDGRVFRYGLAVNSVECGLGVKFSGTMAADGIALTSASQTQAIGDRQFSVASQTFAEDELRGGYAVLYTASSTYQQFGIVGNTAASASTVTIYLDRALTTALTTTNGIEVLPNPYRYLKKEYNYYMSHAGIPMSSATAGQYFWIQTWGPLWANPGPYGQGASVSERDVIFNADGSLRNKAEWGVIVGNQKAGFLMTADSAGTDSPPFIMLQISP